MESRTEPSPSHHDWPSIAALVVVVCFLGFALRTYAGSAPVDVTCDIPQQEQPDPKAREVEEVVFSTVSMRVKRRDITRDAHGWWHIHPGVGKPIVSKICTINGQPAP